MAGERVQCNTCLCYPLIPNSSPPVGSLCWLLSHLPFGFTHVKDPIRVEDQTFVGYRAFLCSSLDLLLFSKVLLANASGEAESTLVSPRLPRPATNPVEGTTNRHE